MELSVYSNIFLILFVEEENITTYHHFILPVLPFYISRMYMQHWVLSCKNDISYEIISQVEFFFSLSNLVPLYLLLLFLFEDDFLIG